MNGQSRARYLLRGASYLCVSSDGGYYAALLPRRGPHIASHYVCPSVCLSVRPVIKRHVAPPSELQWHTCTFRHALTASVLFGTHWGPHIVRPSRPHKFLFYVECVMLGLLTMNWCWTPDWSIIVSCWHCYLVTHLNTLHPASDANYVLLLIQNIKYNRNCCQVPAFSTIHCIEVRKIIVKKTSTISIMI